MIENIARDFYKLHKGKVPVFTLHDCILTTTSHAEEIKEFMQNKFKTLLGIAPNLTLEHSIFENSYRNAS